MLKLTCATKCSILNIHPQLLSQDSQHFTLTLPVLPGAAVLQLAITAKHVVHKLSYVSRFSYLTQYAAPHRSMDVGGASSLSLKCESWLLMPNLRIQFSIHILRGRLYTHHWKSLSIYFISFVSSNWVVIHRQKGED